VRTIRSLAFALFCLTLLTTVVVPAVRAQRENPERKARDMRSMAQQKINPRVMTAIYHRRGDARGKAIAASVDQRVQVDRHGRALVDVRAQVSPELEKKFKALGGIVTAKSVTYDSLVGWLPLQTVERLAADRTVRAIEPGQ
jgi:flagellar biosynthesis/type III secretory pathway M-ring protein FliF/YscJ